MKKILLSALAVATLAVTPTMAEDVAITAQKLPEAAKRFLKEYYAKERTAAVDAIRKPYESMMKYSEKQIKSTK